MFLYIYIRTASGSKVLPSARSSISLHFIDLRFEWLEPRTQKMLEVWLLAPRKHGDERRDGSIPVLKHIYWDYKWWNVLPSARSSISLHFHDLRFDSLEQKPQKMLKVWLLGPPKHGDEQRVGSTPFLIHIFWDCIWLECSSKRHIIHLAPLD
jgi:hypothetical protein